MEWRPAPPEAAPWSRAPARRDEPPEQRSARAATIRTRSRTRRSSALLRPSSGCSAETAPRNRRFRQAVLEAQAMRVGLLGPRVVSRCWVLDEGDALHFV